MTQGDAVHNAVRAVFTDETVPSTTSWTDAQKNEVFTRVLNSFRSGECSHAGNPTTEQLLKYIPGLVNNWVRKDSRLNGGSKYVAKRPGSRSGSTDESVRAMRQLLAATTDSDAKALIQSELDKRLASLKPAVTINAAALPESLRHLVK